jgi:hypothetical protein
MLPKDTRRSHDLGKSDADIKVQRHLRSCDTAKPSHRRFFLTRSNAFDPLATLSRGECDCLWDPRSGLGSSGSDMFSSGSENAPTRSPAMPLQLLLPIMDVRLRPRLRSTHCMLLALTLLKACLPLLCCSMQVSRRVVVNACAQFAISIMGPPRRLPRLPKHESGKDPDSHRVEGSTAPGIHRVNGRSIRSLRRSYHWK